MNFSFLAYSPLEQFKILPIVPLYFGIIDFSIINETLILLLILFFFVVLFLGISKDMDSSFFYLPSR